MYVCWWLVGWVCAFCWFVVESGKKRNPFRFFDQIPRVVDFVRDAEENIGDIAPTNKRRTLIIQ